MPSPDLTRAIRTARRTIEQRESPIRQQLRAAYDRAANSLQGDLDRLTLEIRRARANGEDVNPDWLRRQARYRRLMDQAKVEFNRFSDDGLAILERGRFASISGGAHEAWELARATGATTGFDANINRNAVERTVAAFSEKSPLRGVLDRYGARGAQAIEEELLDGIIKGRSPREISRAIRRQLGNGYTKARLDTLVRTEMQRAFRGSLFDQYAAMGLEQWRWTATHGVRCCNACLAMSGRIFSMKKPFMPSHPGCRCLPSPHNPDLSIPFETGPEWLARQPESTQAKMFPSRESFRAYREGKLKPQDFVGRKRSKVWGSSITERSGRQALKAAGL